MTTLTDWFAWVTLISAVSTALAGVCVERVMGRFLRSKGWLEEESVPDKFLESAKLLVGQETAYSKPSQSLTDLVAEFRSPKHVHSQSYKG